jgi:hypothetical protein
MNNHVHLLIKEVEESISKIMKRVNVSYSIWYNQKYERYGYLFQDRFKSEPVDDDKYFYTVFRYIHQNPLKAKIVNDVKNWKWSSFSEYFNQPSFVDTDFILDMLSEDKKEALERLRSYLSEANDDTCLEYEEKLKISDDEVKLIFVKFGIKNIGELHKSEKKKSDELIKKVKDVKGISIRQLARVTGISKSVIGRI